MAQLHAYAFTSIAQDLTFDASEPATFTALYAISDRRCLELLQVQVQHSRKEVPSLCVKPVERIAKVVEITPSVQFAVFKQG